MDATLSLCLFALERFRTVLLALAVIVLVKTAWVLVLPAAASAAAGG